MNSLFDPLGFVAPIIIEGTFLLRELSSEALDWDSPLPEGKKKKHGRHGGNLYKASKSWIFQDHMSIVPSLTALRKELHVSQMLLSER